MPRGDEGEDETAREPRRSVVLRPELQQFAEAMELRLRENDDKSGWDEMSAERCLARINDEYFELTEAVYLGPTDEDVRHEAEDLANFTFFLWWSKR